MAYCSRACQRADRGKHRDLCNIHRGHAIMAVRHDVVRAWYRSTVVTGGAFEPGTDAELDAAEASVLFFIFIFIFFGLTLPCLADVQPPGRA